MTAPYQYPKSVSLRSYNPATRGHPGQLRRAIDALLRAERPIIYAGGGVIQGNGADLLTRIARSLNFPVTNTLMGLGAFPASDRQFIGMLGMHGTFEANNAMHNCDVIFAIGARFDDRVTNNPKKFCPQATIIHVDVDPASISKIIPADIPIVGPVRAVLEEMEPLLEQELAKRPRDKAALKGWWEQIEAWRSAHGLDHHMLDGADPGAVVLPQQAIQALFQVTRGKAYVTSDSVNTRCSAAQYNTRRTATVDQFRRSRDLGLAFLRRWAVAFPASVVACVTEGSFMMNVGTVHQTNTGCRSKSSTSTSRARHGQTVAGHAVRRPPFTQHLPRSVAEFREARRIVWPRRYARRSGRRLDAGNDGGIQRQTAPASRISRHTHRS